MTRPLYWNSHTSSVMSFLVLYTLGWFSLTSSSFFFSWPKPIDAPELGLTHPLCLYLHRFSCGLCTIKSKPPLCAAWNTGDIALNSHTSSTCFPGWGVRDGTEWENDTKLKKGFTYYNFLHLVPCVYCRNQAVLGENCVNPMEDGEVVSWRDPWESFVSSVE